MEDFRWYKDIFLTKVFNRINGNQPYRRERFIDELPRVFASSKNKNQRKI